MCLHRNVLLNILSALCWACRIVCVIFFSIHGVKSILSEIPTSVLLLSSSCTIQFSTAC